MKNKYGEIIYCLVCGDNRATYLHYENGVSEAVCESCIDSDKKAAK